jgi:hypothetical protein
MIPASLSYGSRGSKNNTFFVCTANKTLSAVNTLPAIVDDLVALGKGIEMYSSVHGDYVLVTAPVLSIQGHNHRQSELSMHKGSDVLCCCRKCLFNTVNNPNSPLRKNASVVAREAYRTRGKQFLVPLNHYGSRLRTKADLCELNSEDIDEDKKRAMCNGLSFIKNGS